MNENILEWAAIGDEQGVLRCLAAGVPVDTRGELGRTALHEAVAGGHLQLARLLIDQGASPRSACDDGWTVFCEAARCHKTEILEWLLTSGADPSPSDIETAIDAAFRSRAPVAIFSILFGLYLADINPWLGAAIHRRRPDAAFELLRLQATRRPSQELVDALCQVVAMNRAFGDALACLIQAGTSLNKCASVTGKTPLTSAITGLCDLDIVDSLLGAGADPLAEDNHRHTPVELACLQGNAPLLSRLLERSAAPTEAMEWIAQGALKVIVEGQRAFFDQAWGQGPRPLHRWDPDLRQRLAPFVDALALIRRYRPLQPDPQWLLVSVLAGAPELCRDLLQVGTDPNQVVDISEPGNEVHKSIRTPHSMLPLIEAIGRQYGAPCQSLLIEHGADVNLADNAGYTPLLVAAFVDEGYLRDETATIEWLLGLGAHPAIQHTSGWITLGLNTPWKDHHAARIGRLLRAARLAVAETRGTMDNTQRLENLFAMDLIQLQRGKLLDLPVLPKAPGFDFGKVEGMLLGLAIGDALGNTSESQLPARRYAERGEIRDYQPNRYAGMRALGLPSDDSQLAFWTLEQMLADGRLIPQNLAQRFRNGRIYGIGETMRDFLRNLGRGYAWHEAGPHSAGNGALMRIAPVLIPHLATGGTALWADVALTAMLTHNDAVSTSACLAFVALLWEVLDMDHAPPAAWWKHRYLELARDLEGDQGCYRSRSPAYSDYQGPGWRFVERVLNDAECHEWSTLEACNRWYSGAYLLETLPCVLYILMRHGTDPEQAIIRAVNDTRDNDTVAAIVGAAVGALHGRDALPKRWRDSLSGRTGEDDDGRIFALIAQAREQFWLKRPL